MFPYFCIVHLPRFADRDIHVLTASDDADAMTEARSLAQAWPGFETVVTYQGERVVGVLANPVHGFPTEPLDWREPMSVEAEAA